jgi:tyrosyl-tRNA synthetase
LDIETRIELVCRPPTDEVLTIKQLRSLLETEDHPIAYNGWEPSGLVHLGTGVICAYKMKDFVQAGIRFKAYLSTWHAWLNNKLGGDLSLIKRAGDLFRHSWIALGVPKTGVEFVYSDELYDHLEYWSKTIRVAKELTLRRTRRTLEIAGRQKTEAHHVSDFLYTPMQIADIFHMEVKICQLGMDQLFVSTTTCYKAWKSQQSGRSRRAKKEKKPFRLQKCPRANPNHAYLSTTRRTQ